MPVAPPRPRRQTDDSFVVRSQGCSVSWGARPMLLPPPPPPPWRIPCLPRTMFWPWPPWVTTSRPRDHPQQGPCPRAAMPNRAHPTEAPGGALGMLSSLTSDPCHPLPQPTLCTALQGRHGRVPRDEGEGGVEAAGCRHGRRVGGSNGGRAGKKPKSSSGHGGHGVSSAKMRRTASLSLLSSSDLADFSSGISGPGDMEGP